LNIVTEAKTNLVCLPLPKFDVNNWEEVTRIFNDMPVCYYEQAWLQTRQPRCLAARTHVGYDARQFWMFSVFEDIDIFNMSVELNQHVYKLGDAFEIFLRPLSGEEYIEFHVTPDNQHMQIRWPRARRSFKDKGWIPDFLSECSFQSWTQIDAENNRWRILAAIPYETLGISVPQEGDEWLYSFGRYDYTRGFKRPILSSTSPHRVRDFHRQHEWNRLVFRTAL